MAEETNLKEGDEKLPLGKTANENISSKSRLIAVLLCWFFGSLGIHRFYVGKTKSAIMQILFGWATLFIWNFVDLIMILCGTFCDAEGKKINRWITEEL